MGSPASGGSSMIVAQVRPGADIVLKLAGTSGPRTVTLGSSPAARVGEKAFAMGNAGGRGGAAAVAAGTVAGLGRSVDQAAGITEQLTGLISASMAVQPGDSGGPMVTATGQVIGTDTAGPTPYPVPAPDGARAGVMGVEVGSPAVRAGLAAGDVITSLGGRAVTSAAAVHAVFKSYHPGDRISVRWVDQDGRVRSAALMLGAGPAG